MRYQKSRHTRRRKYQTLRQSSRGCSASALCSPNSLLLLKLRRLPRILTATHSSRCYKRTIGHQDKFPTRPSSSSCLHHSFPRRLKVIILACLRSIICLLHLHFTSYHSITNRSQDPSILRCSLKCLRRCLDNSSMVITCKISASPCHLRLTTQLNSYSPHVDRTCRSQRRSVSKHHGHITGQETPNLLQDLSSLALKDQ